MGTIVQGIQDEKNAKWLFSSRVLPFIPYHAAAYGAVVKKNRYPLAVRRTTDMSYPAEANVNDNIDYDNDFPELKFMRLTDAAAAAAILEQAVPYPRRRQRHSRRQRWWRI